MKKIGYDFMLDVFLVEREFWDHLMENNKLRKLNDKDYVQIEGGTIRILQEELKNIPDIGTLQEEHLEKDIKNGKADTKLAVNYLLTKLDRMEKNLDKLDKKFFGNKNEKETNN